MFGSTLPKTNIAPENGWLEDDFPFGAWPIFRGGLLGLKSFFSIECNNDAWPVGRSCYNTTTAMLTNFFKGTFKETLGSQPLS